MLNQAWGKHCVCPISLLKTSNSPTSNYFIIFVCLTCVTVALDATVCASRARDERLYKGCVERIQMHDCPMTFWAESSEQSPSFRIIWHFISDMGSSRQRKRRSWFSGLRDLMPAWFSTFLVTCIPHALGSNFESVPKIQTLMYTQLENFDVGPWWILLFLNFCIFMFGLPIYLVCPSVTQSCLPVFVFLDYHSWWWLEPFLILCPTFFAHLGHATATGVSSGAIKLLASPLARLFSRQCHTKLPAWSNNQAFCVERTRISTKWYLDLLKEETCRGPVVICVWGFDVDKIEEWDYRSWFDFLLYLGTEQYI